MLAAPTAEFSVPLRLFSHDVSGFRMALNLLSLRKEFKAAVKVFRTGDGWEEVCSRSILEDITEAFPSLEQLLLSLLNFHASRPAAFTHRYITSSLFVNVHEISTRGIRSTKAMVTRWYGQGDVLTYLKRHPGASKFALVSKVALSKQF